LLIYFCLIFCEIVSNTIARNLLNTNKIDEGVFNTAAEIDYEYIAALKAETLVLGCNVSRSSEVKWTHRPTNDNRSYTYVVGSFPGRYGTEGRFSIVTSSKGEQSLRIYNAQLGDSGRYDCYGRGNIRRSGYQLNITGVFSTTHTKIK